MPNGVEAYDEAYDEASDEAFRPVRIGPWRPSPVPQRPSDRPVTQAQLQMAVNRLDGYINRNRLEIQRVNSSLTALGRDVRRQRGELRTVRKDLSTARDAIVLIPLLSSAFGTNKTLGALFPLLLLGGMGGSGQGGGGGGLFGGDDATTMLILVLALSGGLGR